MPGIARDRSRNVNNTGRIWSSVGQNWSTKVYWAERHWCSDIVGDPEGDHPLTIEKWKKVGALNGQWSFPDGSPKRIAEDYPYTLNLPKVPWYYEWPVMSWSEAATKAIARTNPSQAHVSLPVFVFELHELPRLVLLAGRTILQKAASANLSYQFGWRPLLSDLRKMLNFDTAFDRKAQEIENLYTKGGIRKRVRLGRWSWAGLTDPNEIINSNHVAIHASREDSNEVEMWATVRWAPQTSSIPSTSEERRRLARKLVLGVHSGQQLANVWEAIPWSWLIDWFGNIGDFLEASNNSIAFVSGDVNVMRHIQGKAEYRPFNIPDGMKSEPATPYAEHTWKERKLYPGDPQLVASRPFLSGRQLSILGSLAILKNRGRFR